MSDVHVVGLGIHPFGRFPGLTALDLGVRAVENALEDAGLRWDQLQFAFGGSWEVRSADAILPRLGLTGISFINVANGCATGASALIGAQGAIASGQYDIGLVVGFDGHEGGAFNFPPELFGLPAWYGETGFMLTTQFFAMKIKRYMDVHGISDRSLGLVAEKAFANGALAPHAWRREPIPLEQILASPLVSDPLRKFMFCSPNFGAAALIVASARKMRELGLAGPRIRAVALRTRREGSFEVFSPSFDAAQPPSPTELAAKAVFEAAGVGPDEIDVAQLQDTESGAEIMHMAENGFCGHGEQEAWIADGATRLGGRLPVNTDGGCIACGEPIGASGLRQIHENVLQLRGAAQGRQIEDARLAYSQVYGMPGVSATAILEAH